MEGLVLIGVVLGLFSPPREEAIPTIDNREAEPFDPASLNDRPDFAQRVNRSPLDWSMY